MAERSLSGRLSTVVTDVGTTGVTTCAAEGYTDNKIKIRD
jgi:hypothetical protein